MRSKRPIFVLSLCILAFVSLGCGKKARPVPKGLPVPASISDVKAEAKDGVLFLSFSVPTKNEDGSELRNLAGFRIVRSCGGCGGGFESWKTISLTERKGYTIKAGRLFTYDNDLRQGFSYGYRVYPYTGSGVAGNGSNTVLMTWNEPPAAPRDLTEKEEDSRIVLTWTAEPAMVYNVYRWEGETYPLTPLNGAPVVSPTFTDSNLVNGRQYRYEVRVVRVEGTVPYEGEGAFVSATPRDKTAPTAPLTLKLERKGDAVSLSWGANSEYDLSGYNVYRVAAGETRKVNVSLVQTPKFVDENPGQESYISYYITAVDKAGNESDRSQEQTIILKE